MQVVIIASWLQTLIDSLAWQIIGIMDIVQPGSFEDFKEIYCAYSTSSSFNFHLVYLFLVVQELMETDLYRVIRNPASNLTDDHREVRVYQSPAAEGRIQDRHSTLCTRYFGD